MSSLRRRMMMAEKPSGMFPPESTSFGFPLYLNVINFAIQVAEGNYIELRRGADAVSNELFEWLEDIRGGERLWNYEITEDTPIFINGVQIQAISYERSENTYFFYGLGVPFEENTVSFINEIGSPELRGVNPTFDWESLHSAIYLQLNTTNEDNAKVYELMERECVNSAGTNFYDWYPGHTNIYISGIAEGVSFNNILINYGYKESGYDFFDLLFDGLSKVGSVAVCRIYENGLLECFDDD